MPVMGISEWMCYYANYGLPGGERPEVIEECVEAHLECGVDQIVWNCGRSVVDYWSELPGATRMCEDGTRAGSRDWSFVAELMQKVCPLRRAMEVCRARGATILGRLAMNHHYGGRGYEAITSRFAREHPQYHERSRLGSKVPHRLCYGIEEVRQERLDILLEIQRVGVDGVVLDFCRQMPILMYHEALVGPYVSERGVDPRSIDSADPRDYADWFQYRADVLTAFMRELRRQVRRQEADLGKPCGILARVPDSAPWLMLAFGLDVERWCSEDLVDGTMLSPFPVCLDEPGGYPEYHVGVAHRHGKLCIGGIGSKHLIENDTDRNTGFFHSQPVYELASVQYAAGVDGMSLYQSETLVRMDYLRSFVREVGHRDLVARRARELPRPEFPPHYPIGMDWHAGLVHSVDARRAGDAAL